MPRKKSREFSRTTIELLERRAGHKCSNPDCEAPTSGASGEDYAKLGQAAHINAVASDGPRYDPNLDDNYISSQENGIWLCYNCHKKIDNKRTKKFTVELLKEWKRNRELIAEFEVGRPKVQDIDLYKDQGLLFKNANNNEIATVDKLKINENMDNYGLGKGVINQFKEIDDHLINRLIYEGKKKKKKSDIDNYMLEIFEWIIGNRTFPYNEIEMLYKKYDNTILDGDIDIIKIKRSAFLSYFDGKIEKCKQQYDILFKRYDEIKEKWIKDDILIDGRNLLYKIESIKRKIFRNNKYENKIAENGYNVQYPYIDRLEKEILHNSIERTCNYKYKKSGVRIFGVGLEQIFSNIQKVIYISVLYGSYTQILSLRRIIGNVLILYSERLNNEELYREALRFYVLSGDYTEFKNIADKIEYKYKFINSNEYLTEILKLRNSILVYSVDYFNIFIYDYFGRILSENEYIKYENKMLEILKGQNNMLINSVLKAIPNNIVRIKKIDQLFIILKSKTESLVYRRQIQTILNYISYNDLSEKNRNAVKEMIDKMVINKDYLVIIDLLIDIKKIDNTDKYDEILLKDGSDNALLFRIKESDGYKPEYLELIVDEITRRNKSTIETRTITGYGTTYNMVSNFYDEDSPELRRVIDSKVIPLIDFSISNKSIEVIERLKLLRNLMYLHFLDGNYDKKIAELLNKLNMEDSNSAFSTHYNPDYLLLYKYLFDYLFNSVTLNELLNCYLFKIIEKNYLFSEIKLIIEYVSTKIKYTDSNLNIIFIIINLMINSDINNNREHAIKLSKILYNTKYFDLLYDKFVDISKNSTYNEMKSIAFLIKEINDNENIKIATLKNNIINNRNFNIRYIGEKYLI